LRCALLLRVGETAPKRGGIKVGSVDRSAGLLPPGIIQATSVDRVESKLVDEPKHHFFRLCIVARDR
jgi:hypothetical protein